MASMSYCRFENTSIDFSRCLDDVEDMVNGDKSPLSESELRSAKRLTNDMIRILELLADYDNTSAHKLVNKGSIDPEVIDVLWDKLNNSAG